MNKEKLIVYLDKFSFIFLAISAILISIFKMAGNVSMLRFSILIFAIGILFLIAFLGTKLYYSIKNEEYKDEFFVLNKNQKIWLGIKIIMCVILLCFILMVFFKFKQF